jgi:hypothetical protein
MSRVVHAFGAGSLGTTKPTGAETTRPALSQNDKADAPTLEVGEEIDNR